MDVAPQHARFKRTQERDGPHHRHAAVGPAGTGLINARNGEDSFADASAGKSVHRTGRFSFANTSGSGCNAGTDHTITFTEKRSGANYVLARSAGKARGADEKTFDHRDGCPGAAGSAATATANPDRSNPNAAVLGIARHFNRGFDFADLELCFLMATTDTSATINLDESNFDKEINSDTPVLVDFWAEWCGPCKLIAPLLDEIAREKAGAVKVAKVNVDDNQSLSFKYNIRAIPSLLFFKNGQLRDQITGMTSKKDLLSRIEALA